MEDKRRKGMVVEGGLGSDMKIGNSTLNLFRLRTAQKHGQLISTLRCSCLAARGKIPEGARQTSTVTLLRSIRRLPQFILRRSGLGT